MTVKREMPKAGVKEYRRAAVKLRSVNDAERTIEFVASTEDVDRYGDVIRVAGWKLENYLQNPVFLWGHRSGDPPIGSTDKISIEMNPPALVHTVRFAKYPFADAIYELYREGHMRAVSVGFMPDPDKTKRRMDEEGNELDGLEFNGQELLELSAVDVPANPLALARMVQKGVLTEEQAKGICGEDNPPWANWTPGIFYPEGAADADPAMVSLATDPKREDISDPAKLNTRQRLEMFCDEGRRLIADAQSQMAAIRLTVDQSRSMTREGLWQISEELAALGSRIAELEKRSASVVTVDADAVRAVVRAVLDEQPVSAAGGPAKETATGDGGAPEKPASETLEPETESSAPGELAPGVVAILETLISQPAQ